MSEDTKKPTLLPAWRNVAREIEQGRYTYGDLIAWEELDQIMCMPRPSAADRADRYQVWQLQRLQQVDLLRKHLLRERQMYLDTEIGNGLRILHPHEQTARVQAKGRAELAKALRDMGAGLQHVNRSMLTAEQQRENTDAQVRLAAKIAAVRDADRSIRTEIKRIS